MARMHHWLGLAIISFSLVGCISQEKYNALKLERDRFAEQLGQAQNEASAARSEAEAYKNQLAAVMQGGRNSEGLSLNLTNQNAELQRQIDELTRKYQDALARTGTAVALPQELSNELSDFAAANPEVDFDAAKGIVKFKSDVTFALGSSQLTPKVRDVISRFAQILNSNTAANYELMIAGHTDNTRVVNPQTISAGHKDNWYLSAHRAIAVGSELQSQRINPQRLAVTGYADQRPIASNASASGQAQNRRVEVLILPTTIRGGSAPVAASAVPARSITTPAPNKDTAPRATIDNQPAFNK